MIFYRISEVIYLIIATLALYRTVTIWNSEREKAYLFALFALMAIIAFMIRKHYRKKLNKKHSKK